MKSECGKCGKCPANPLKLLRQVCCGKCGKPPSKLLKLLRAVCGSCAYRYYVSISAPFGEAGTDSFNHRAAAT